MLTEQVCYSDSSSHSDSDEKVSKSAPMSHSPRSKKTKLKDKLTGGIVYPSDLWFLIATYIPPEDLSRFALICKDAYRVILSVHFWKQLCARFDNLT